VARKNTVILATQQGPVQNLVGYATVRCNVSYNSDLALLCLILSWRRCYDAALLSLSNTHPLILAYSGSLQNG